MSVQAWCAIVLLAASAPAAAQTRPRTPRVVSIRPLEATVSNAVVMPPALQFAASDPDLGRVQANTPATVVWQIMGARPTGTWALTVQAEAATFSGCGRVPVTAVTVRCASVSSGGHGGAGTCGAPFQLSNQPQTLATGSQGNGNARFTVTVSFTFQDGWQYTGAVNPPCTLNLNYTIQAS